MNALHALCLMMLTAVMSDPTHATRGIVTTASVAEIVVARPKDRGAITITLSPETHIDGTLRVGATVSVRYHDDHGRHVAIAISVERPP